MHGLTEGIVDFNPRRTIVSDIQLASGLLGHVVDRMSRSPSPSYVLLDDTSMSSWSDDHWTEPQPMYQPGLPRPPLGLSFLDLLSGGLLVDVAELGRELVRGAHADRYELTLNVDHIPWPQADGFPGARQRPRIAQLLDKLGPSQRPRRGVIPAEVWIDEQGRLALFGYCDLPTCAVLITVAASDWLISSGLAGHWGQPALAGSVNTKRGQLKHGRVEVGDGDQLTHRLLPHHHVSLTVTGKPTGRRASAAPMVGRPLRRGRIGSELQRSASLQRLKRLVHRSRAIQNAEPCAIASGP